MRHNVKDSGSTPKSISHIEGSPDAILLIYSGMVEKLILIVPFAACVILCAVRDMGCVRDIVLRA